MTTLDHTALMRAILESPADDLPRLALADHLEESGQDERAEFIRVQCELFRWEREMAQSRNPDARVCAHAIMDRLRRRERELFHVLDFPVLDESLLDGLRITEGELKLCELPSKGLVRRGFIASINLPLDAFLRHAEALFLAQPIEEVKLVDINSTTLGNVVSWGKRVSVVQRYSGANLPHHLFDLLTGRPDGEWWMDYDTPTAAYADLSAACVRYGRELRDKAWKEGRG